MVNTCKKHLFTITNKYCVFCELSKRKKEIEQLKEELSIAKQVIFISDTPFCHRCKTDFVKDSGYTWKPNCDCLDKSMRISKG